MSRNSDPTVSLSNTIWKNIPITGRFSQNRVGISALGFTLVELLTVLAIVALLVALLFPTFAASQERSRQVRCFSNLRQIGVALSLYAQDSDDSYPQATDTSEHLTYSWSSRTPELMVKISLAPVLRTILNPYTKSDALWRCPSDTGQCERLALSNAKGVPVSWPACENMYESKGTSYVYRAELGFGNVAYPATGTDFASPPHRLSSAQIGVAMDATPFWHGTKIEKPDYDQGQPSSMLFADGHVASVRDTQFFQAWLFGLDTRD